MQQAVKVSAWALLYFVLASGVASAQSSVAGSVKDTTGAVLPGVTVEVESPALIERVRTVVTDGQGQYQIIDLRPGTYSVTFTLPGFTQLKREGLELQANFTATVNADLKVGSIDETLTVTGQSPLVDIQNVTQREIISRDLLDTVPATRGQLGFAALMPSVVIPVNFQDVGGGQGEASTRMSIHGSKSGDQKLLIDGMRYTTLVQNGAGRVTYINPASIQEVITDQAAGGAAEYSTGGAMVDLVPKDGGNKITGYFFTSYSGHQLQGSNLTADLKDRGLRATGAVRQAYDVNGAVGGPVMRDKLWFYSAHRVWGATFRWPNQFYNADINSWFYEPAGPMEPWAKYSSNNIRLTWQASQKHKVTFFMDKQKPQQRYGTVGSASSGTGSAESLGGLSYPKDSVTQATWTYPATPRLLFQAGLTVLRVEFFATTEYGSWPDAASAREQPISVLEQSTNFRYRSAATSGHTHPGQTNGRVSMSYVTGSHHFKTGLVLMRGTNISETYTNKHAVSYTFLNRVPIQLTQYATPYTITSEMRPELGLFAQDRWTLNRLTASLGLRFDHLHMHIPASQQPAGALIDARSFEAVDCVPCWNDINLRGAVSYDLFGDGKTALKASVGRYVLSEATSVSSANNPVSTSINSVNRAWTDIDGDFVTDCDLRNPLVNGECQQISNLNFGKPNIVTRYDPEVINGWQRRPYNWQTSAQIQHELRPGVAVGAGYFRTWYGNFTVTDNLEVTPQDYDQYCITVPADPRLPGGGGNQICGLYDINQAKFGRVNNLVTFASKYGEQTEIYNGVDFNFSARIPRGELGGGLNVGNSIASGTIATTSSTRSCFVVDSPQALYQCDKPLPYRTQIKVHGSYLLPLGLQLGANFQSLPGAPLDAIRPVPTAEIVPSLGRNLAGGTRSVSISMVAPNTLFEDRINQLDLRMAKIFRVRGVTWRAMLDAYNVFNASSVLAATTTYGPNWLAPTLILDARMFKFGVQLEF